LYFGNAKRDRMMLAPSEVEDEEREALEALIIEEGGRSEERT
jgi:hypothetical protein